MCIYLSDNAIFVLVFIAGLVLGAIIYRIVTATSKPIDYDGTNGKGYQPRPTPPKPLHNPCK